LALKIIIFLSKQVIEISKQRKPERIRSTITVFSLSSCIRYVCVSPAHPAAAKPQTLKLKQLSFCR